MLSDIEWGKGGACGPTTYLLFFIVHFPREIVAQIKDSPCFLVHGWIGHVLSKLCAFVTDVAIIAVSALTLIFFAC